MCQNGRGFPVRFLVISFYMLLFNSTFFSIFAFLSQKEDSLKDTGNITDLKTRLALMLEEQASFVAYRLPESDEVVLFRSGAMVRFRISEFAPENFEGAFVVAPFDVKERAFAVYPEGRSFIFNLPEGKSLSGKESPAPPAESSTDREKYGRDFSRMKDALAREVVDKVVLARRMEVSGVQSEVLPDVFLELCRRYPSAFVYFFDHPGMGRWMGASPETFLQKDGAHWHTVSLAATRKGDYHYEDWDLKELEEQGLVSVFIDDVLKRHGLKNFEKKGPVPFSAGNVIHLRTSYRFSVKDNSLAGSLIEALHPTPAVGGYPKRQALEVIRQIEGFDRGFYSGFLGPVSRDAFHFFVNIRCMQLGHDHAVLYLGGGLTRDSREQAEWEETRLKAATLLSVLHSVKQNHCNESSRL